MADSKPRSGEAQSQLRPWAWSEKRLPVGPVGTLEQLLWPHAIIRFQLSSADMAGGFMSTPPRTLTDPMCKGLRVARSWDKLLFWLGIGAAQKGAGFRNCMHGVSGAGWGNFCDSACYGH